MSKDISTQLKDLCLPLSTKKKISALLNSLSDEIKINDQGIKVRGTRTRFIRLLDPLLEIGNPNSVSLWVRYFWDNEIQKALHNKFYYPSTIELDLTTYCNNSCFFCKEGLRKNRCEYPFKKLQKDLKEFSKIPQIKSIIYSGGGDPTCYSRIIDALSLTYNYGFSIYLSTNGGLIGQPQLPLQLFVDNISILKFSIDAPTHETYNRIHHSTESVEKGAPESVDYVFDQVKALVQLRDNQNRVIRFKNQVRKLPLIVIGMVVNSINQKETLLMAQRAVKVGADMLWFRPPITVNKTIVNIKDGVKQMEDAKRLFGDKILIKTFNHRLDFNTLQEDYFARCICHPVINPDGAEYGKGSLTPCLFRRGNRPDNYWLAIGSPCVESIIDLIKSKEYSNKIKEQNENLHSISARRCPRCRKTLNNIFFDILSHSSLKEQETMKEIILAIFPATIEGEIIKYLY